VGVYMKVDMAAILQKQVPLCAGDISPLHILGSFATTILSAKLWAGAQMHPPTTSPASKKHV